MKITDVQVALVEASIPQGERVESGAGPKLSRQAAFIEIATDGGISGVGPCSFGSVAFELSFLTTLVQGAFRPLLIGRDPFATEAIWTELYYGLLVRSLGARGVGVAILSAIDVALWDIKGKALKLPVYSLLGGPVRSSVPAYASSVYWGAITESVRVAREFAHRGYTAIKVKVGRSLRQDIERIEAVVDAVGPAVQIMVDANLSYTRNQALTMGRVLDRLGVIFFEEPLALDDIEGYGLLARQLDVMIAVGENLYTRWDFLPYIDAGVDVLQPDCSRVGGFSEARRVAELAAARHRLVAPHTFSDILTLTVNLHLAMSLASVFTLEVDETYNPLMTALVHHPVRPEGGQLIASEAPGLGVELDREWICSHAYSGLPGIGIGTMPGGSSLKL